MASVVLAGCHEERPIAMPDLVGMPQLPPGTHIAPDPYEDPVVSQYPEAGERVARNELVELETRCTMLRFQQAACS